MILSWVMSKLIGNVKGHYDSGLFNVPVIQPWDRCGYPSDRTTVQAENVTAVCRGAWSQLLTPAAQAR